MAKKTGNFPGFGNYQILFDTDTKSITVVNRHTHQVVKPNQTHDLAYTLYHDGGGKQVFKQKDFDVLFNNNQKSNEMANSKKGGAAATRSKKQGEVENENGTPGSPVAETATQEEAPVKTAETLQAEKDAAEKEKAEKKAADEQKKKDDSAAKLAELQAMPTSTKEEMKAIRDAAKGFKFTAEDRKAFNDFTREKMLALVEPKKDFVKANGEPRKILSVNEIAEIRSMLAEKKEDGTPVHTIPEIAKKFGALKRTIRGIRDGKRFAGVGVGEVGQEGTTAETTAATATEGQAVPEATV
jgi:hypothetical protein